MSLFQLNGRPSSLCGAMPIKASVYRMPDASPDLDGRGVVAAFASLGCPLNIREVAELIGCSPWTVRQSLIPRGLPHFRITRYGRLTFYREQVIRWIERQQQGGRRRK